MDGGKVAEGRIERTQPMVLSADETADVGEDDATPLTEDYRAYDNRFTGRILRVTVDVKEMGAGEKAGAAKAAAEAGKKMEEAKQGRPAATLRGLPSGTRRAGSVAPGRPPRSGGWTGARGNLTRNGAGGAAP